MDSYSKSMPYAIEARSTCNAALVLNPTTMTDAMHSATKQP